jgi:hypothetical protein
VDQTTINKDTFSLIKFVLGIGAKRFASILAVSGDVTLPEFSADPCDMNLKVDGKYKSGTITDLLIFV